MNSPETAAEDSKPSWPLRHPGLAITLLVAVHLAFLSLFFEPAISGPDTNGYLAQARLIAREGTTGIVVESPAQFIASHWMPTSPGTYFGQYPPGLPAILALPFRAFGPAASLWTNIAFASLTLLGVFLVGRDWLGPGWGLLAALLMAFNPTANQHAVEADAHTAVAFFLVWGLLFLTRWDRTGHPAWAAAAGLFAGVIPTIRYPEALFGLAFAAFIALTKRPIRHRLAAISALAAGSMIPMLALFARNQTAFGAFWKTGYSVSGEQTAFSLAYLAQHFFPYLLFLVILGAPLVAVTGAIGAVALARRPETRRFGLLLIGLTLPITLLYIAYYWHADPISMRFLIPTFFLYALATVGGLKLLAESTPRRSRRYASILIGTTALLGLGLSIFSLWQLKQENATLARITQALRTSVPAGSIVIADNGLQQHLDFIGDWRLARAETVLGDRGGPPGMLPEPVVINPESPEVRPRAAEFRQSLALWAAAVDRPIFWVASADQLETLKQLLPAIDTFHPVGTVSVPVRERGPGPGGPPGKRARGGLFGRLFGLPPRPPPAERTGGPPGPFPGGPGTGTRADTRTPTPERFAPPADGKLQILAWTINQEDQKQTSAQLPAQ